MRTLIALALVSGWSIAQELPRSGTIGDAPPADRRIVVDVSADGAIRVAGKERDFAGLRAALLAAKDRHPRTNVLLRADRRLPWIAMQWIMTACADARLYRVFHAVLPEKGDEEGALALFLPRVRGIVPVPQEPQRYTRLVAHLIASEKTTDPDLFYARLRKVLDALDAAQRERVIFELKATHHAPYGYAMRVLDLVFRAGIRRLRFYGTAIPPRRADLKELVRKVRAGGMRYDTTRKLPDGIGIRLMGREIDPGGKPAAPPVPKRVRGGFAGLADGDAAGGRAAEEIEEEEVEEAPEPEEEIVEEPIETEEVRDHEGKGGGVPEPGASPGPPGRGPGGRRVLGPGTRADNPVEIGVAWLAGHQDVEADGRWDCDEFMKHDPKEDRCDGAGQALHDVPITALGLLALMGAGYTDRGSKPDNPYARNVRAGLRFLMSAQDEEGHFGSRVGKRHIYGHAMATAALCEAYRNSRNPRYKKPAQEGLNHLALHRNPFDAWRYGTRDGESDTSVTVWCLLALASGRHAGLDVDPDAFEGARAWIEKMTHSDTGRVGYRSNGGDSWRPTELARRFPADRTAAMTAAGVVCRALLGEEKAGPMIEKGAAIVAELPPLWDATSGRVDMYYWHLGSAALTRVGGERWKAWDRHLLAALGKQRVKGSAKGSWDPVGVWGREGGRVYATAMMTLCAEIHFRYDRAFGAR